MYIVLVFGFVGGIDVVEQMSLFEYEILNVLNCLCVEIVHLLDATLEQCVHPCHFDWDRSFEQYSLPSVQQCGHLHLALTLTLHTVVTHFLVLSYAQQSKQNTLVWPHINS